MMRQSSFELSGQDLDALEGRGGIIGKVGPQYLRLCWIADI